MTLTVTPFAVDVAVAEAIAEICAATISSTVLPPMVRELALTVVTENVAVSVTVRFVNVPEEDGEKVGSEITPHLFCIIEWRGKTNL